MKRAKWGIGVLVIAGTTVGLAIYLAFGNAISARLFHERVTEPDPEEYAVFSGFLNGFFSSNRWFPFLAVDHSGLVYLENTSISMPSPGSILPLDVVALGSEEMAHDFYRKNRSSWPLRQAPESPTRIVIVSRTSSLVARRSLEARHSRPRFCEFGDPDKSFGLMRLSRPGFNHRKTLALLYFTYYCGPMGGQGGWVLLAKAGGRWLVKTYGSGWIS
jgi:hypothetical protein